MKVIVFAGPTISADAARGILEATYLPPVRQGDVYRACQSSPDAIGIIDGYFDRVPSVWHKEILHALQTGVHVFGGASMGALRAVELEAFGMVGVGAVFEAFRAGGIEDDDEVAIAHGPAAEGYRALSEAAVNIRATLAAAVAAGVIGTYGAQGLLATAKALPYEQRSYPTIVAAAARRVPAPDLARFNSWWPTGRIDQKQRDAVALLEALKAFLATEPGPKKVDFEVELTDAWREACEPLRQAPLVWDERPAAEVAILEELQVSGHYSATYARAFTRALILDRAPALDAPAGAAEVNDTLGRFRQEQGLAPGEELQRWRLLAGLELDDDFLAFLRRQADVYRAEVLLAREARRCVPDQLRLGGKFGHLLARARHKREALRATLEGEPELSDTRMTEDQLWEWYFGEVLRTERPASLEATARRFGFDDTRSFRAAVVRERLFQQGRTTGNIASGVASASDAVDGDRFDLS
jgi:hypothetical protein